MFPGLSEPYTTALRTATRDIEERLEPTGILVSGSIIRGDPHPASDLDIVVRCRTTSIGGCWCAELSTIPTRGPDNLAAFKQQHRRS